MSGIIIVKTLTRYDNGLYKVRFNLKNIKMELFNTDEKHYLPLEYKGKETKNGGLTKNNPRKWTEKEIEWALNLKYKGFKNKDIAKFLYRELVSVSIKIKRLAKKDGVTYNEPHREDKYFHNDLFLAEINPKFVLIYV